MTNFNELYKDTKHPWGIEPVEEIKKFSSILKPGSILDIGVGDGRNVLSLANDFEVTGLDCSSEGIKNFYESAEELNLRQKVLGLVEDISTYKLTKSYDNIFSINLIHFLPRKLFPSISQMIKDHTEVGGLNIIVDFTQEGSIYNP